MPTTRLTAVKTASGTENNSLPLPSKESARENRKARFNARKTREPLIDPTPRQRVMIQFLSAITNVDKRYLLWSRPAKENAVTLETIEDCVYKGKYEDMSSFKSDFDKLLLSILPFAQLYHKDLDALKALNTFTSKCLKFEAERLKEDLSDVDTLFRVTALFRPTTDGYSFTDIALKDPSAGPTTDLPVNVQEVVIHPAPPAEDVPTLKQVVAPPPVYYPKISKHEEKPVVPVQWLDFGAFSSYAPASDSNIANATYENTYMGRATKRLCRKKKNQPIVDIRDDMDLNEEEDNALWLQKEGIDIEIIQTAMDKAPENVNEELEKNSELLEELITYQKSRFNQDESKWANVDERETEIAKTLEHNIAIMLSRLPPNATTDNHLIEKTMERLPLFEPSYRGTLPPHKIFSFPTTEKAENLPPYANITPTYSKENWRLVKVAPLPPKEGKENPLPPTSMVEQQISFYPKPQYNQPMPPPPQARAPVTPYPQQVIQQQQRR